VKLREKIKNQSQQVTPLALPSPPWGEDLGEGKKEIPILLNY